MTALGVFAVLQAISLMIFAPALGPSNYSVIIICGAAAAVATEFVGLGTDHLLMRDVSRNPAAYGAAFGRSFRYVAATIIPFALIATWLVSVCFNVDASWKVLLALVASDVVGMRFAAMAEHSAIAHHATHFANTIRIIVSLIRFSTVCIAVYIFGVSDAAGWAIFAVASSLICAALGLGMIIARFGPPQLKKSGGSSSDAGLLFLCMQVTRAIQFSLDRFAVAGVASAATLGAYGVASRIAQMGIMPASAVTRIAYPLFFKKGASGLDPAVRFALRIAPAVVGVGLLSSIALVGIGYALPWLLGASFAPAKGYLMVLALLPLASTLQTLSGDIFSGSDLQGQRVVAALLGLVIAAAVTFLGAKLGGTWGAAVGYITGHFLFAATMVLAVFVMRRRVRSQ